MSAAWILGSNVPAVCRMEPKDREGDALTRAAASLRFAPIGSGEEFVRSFFRLAAAMLTALAFHVESARAENDAAYVVTYVEVVPAAVAPTVALLKKYRDASFHQDGNLREEVLQALERPTRFA